MAESAVVEGVVPSWVEAEVADEVDSEQWASVVEPGGASFGLPVGVERGVEVVAPDEP